MWWFDTIRGHHVPSKELLIWNRELMTLSKTELLEIVMKLRIQNRRLELLEGQRRSSERS